MKKRITLEDLEQELEEKPKVLVTGAEGFVGRRLSRILEEKGYDVIRTDVRTRSKLVPNNFLYADLSNPNFFISELKNVDIIFHVASIFDFSTSFMRLYEVNVLGTLRLIEEAVRAGVKKMVLFSSAAVYGDCDPEWYGKEPIEENWGYLNPNYGGNYDLSKRLQEMSALVLAKYHNFDLTVIRPAPIYGAESFYGMYDLIRMVKEHSIGAIPRNFHKKPLPMVHVDDVCNAAIHLAESGVTTTHQIYNICDDYTLDMVDTLKYIAHLTDSKIKILLPIHPKIFKMFKPFMNLFGKMSAWIARKFRDGAKPKLETDTMNYMFGNYLFSNKKIKNTGFEFKYPDRREGLLQVIKWYKKFNKW